MMTMQLMVLALAKMAVDYKSRLEERGGVRYCKNMTNNGILKETLYTCIQGVANRRTLG